MKEGLLSALSELMEFRFSQISKPLRKNLACLSVAFVTVLATVRSGYGHLSLAALVRGLPIEGDFHKREKRLHRFLKNSHLDYRSVTSSLAPLLLAFLLAYTLCILLGESKLGQQARGVFEVPRRTPRHGTTRTLSALMVGMLMLSHPDFRGRCICFLIKIINRAINGYTWLPKRLFSLPCRMST